MGFSTFSGSPSLDEDFNLRELGSLVFNLRVVASPPLALNRRELPLFELALSRREEGAFESLLLELVLFLRSALSFFSLYSSKFLGRPPVDPRRCIRFLVGAGALSST